MDRGARPLLALLGTAAGLTCSSGSGKAQFLFSSGDPDRIAT